MDRNIPTLNAVIILTSVIAAILLYMQSTPQLFKAPITQLSGDSAVTLSADFAHSIVDLNGSAPDLDLSQYGVDSHTGQMLRLSNGHIIINTAGQSTSLLHKIRRFQRKKELPAKGGVSSLLKCTAKLESCEPWGSQRLRFDTPWGGLELANGNILILDTSRHQLHLSSAEGQHLDTLEGFYFPNHAELVRQADSESAWVSNTNTNELIEVQQIEQRLELSGKSIWLGSFSQIDAKRRFPSSALKYHDDWLILTHKNGMNAGAVYRLHGNAAKRLLPGLTDITNIHIIGDTLYAFDYQTFSIWSLKLDTADAAGKQFKSINFSKANTRADKAVQDNREIFYMLLTVLALIALTALIMALRKPKPTG